MMVQRRCHLIVSKKIDEYLWNELIHVVNCALENRKGGDRCRGDVERDGKTDTAELVSRGRGSCTERKVEITWKLFLWRLHLGPVSRKNDFR